MDCHEPSWTSTSTPNTVESSPTTATIDPVQQLAGQANDSSSLLSRLCPSSLHVLFRSYPSAVPWLIAQKRRLSSLTGDVQLCLDSSEPMSLASPDIHPPLVVPIVSPNNCDRNPAPPPRYPHCLTHTHSDTPDCSPISEPQRLFLVMQPYPGQWPAAGSSAS